MSPCAETSANRCHLLSSSALQGPWHIPSVALSMGALDIWPKQSTKVYQDPLRNPGGHRSLKPAPSCWALKPLKADATFSFLLTIPDAHCRLLVLIDQVTNGSQMVSPKRRLRECTQRSVYSFCVRDQGGPPRLLADLPRTTHLC